MPDPARSTSSHEVLETRGVWADSEVSQVPIVGSVRLQGS